MFAEGQRALDKPPKLMLISFSSFFPFIFRTLAWAILGAWYYALVLFHTSFHLIILIAL